MSLNAIVRWFKPKEMLFFDLLEKSADNLCESVRFFHEELKVNDSSRWEDLRRRMKSFEHVGDDLNREIVDRLDQTFVAPIERDDILHLSNALDDVLDRVDAVSEKLVLYRVGQIKPCALEITTLLIDGASYLMFLMRSLRSMTNVREMREKIRQVQKIEAQVDTIYNSSVGNLFATTADAIELIKWKEIIKDLEDASDSIALVAKVVGSTITKNA